MGENVMSSFGYSKEKHKMQDQPRQRSDPLPKLESVKDFPIADLSFRGIKKEVTEFFKVRGEFHPVKGTLWRVYFPATKNSKLVGYIVCNLHYTNPDLDKWRIIGKVSPSVDLVGQYRAAPSGNRVYVTEGMFDYLSVWQALYFGQREEGKYIPNVVSIGFGTATAAEHISNNLEFLNGFKEIVTAFDNDEATEAQRKKGVMKGREATSAVQTLLAGRGKFVKLMPDSDPNDYLQSGKESELYYALLDLHQFNHAKVLMGSPADVQEILTPINRGVMLDCFPLLMKKLQGFRQHEITTILAPPKAGKSSWSRQITWHLLKELQDQPDKVCMAFLEDTKLKVAQSFAALEANVKLIDYRDDPQKYGDAPAVRAHHLLESAGMVITSDNGKVKPDEIVPLFEYAYNLGCRWFIFDHFSYVISGDSDGKKSERERLDGMLTDLECWVKKRPVHVVGIAHVTIDKAELRRARSAATKKDESDPSEPYWYRVTPYDGRGSNIFSQISANIIGIHKQFLPGGGNGYTQLDLLECREAYNGRADLLTIPEGEARLKCVGREY